MKRRRRVSLNARKARSGWMFCLPFVLVTYWGLLMLFDLKAPKWHPGFVIFTLWLISLVAFCVLTVLKIPDLGLWM